MPSAELLNLPPTFPIGTAVDAYEGVIPDAGEPRPIGDPLDSAVVDGNGNLFFGALPTAGTNYVAAARVEGPWRFRYFNTPAPAAEGAEGVQAALESHEARTGNVHGILDTSNLATKDELGSTIVVNRHGADPEAERLEGEVNLWVGTVTPDNMTEADIFLDESGLEAADIEGLGAAALLNVGVIAGTVAAGDDARITGAEQVANKDTDVNLAANSNVKYPSQKAIKAYVDNLLAASNAVVYKGVIDCSGNPNYPAADAGHLYRVSVAGKIGGGAGTNVEVGDTLLCTTDGSAAGTQAEVGAKWNVIQANLDGAVIGPAAAVSDQLAAFNGATGKIIKDSGLGLDTDGTLAANSNVKVPSQKAVKTYADAEKTAREAADALSILKSIVTTKGDIIGASAASTPVRVAVGANTKVLGAASGEASGLKWLDNNRIESHTFSIAAPTAAKLGGFFIRVATGEAVTLLGVRYKTDAGTAKFKVKRETAAKAVTEPFKEKEAKNEAQEQTPGTALEDKDYLSAEVESVTGATFLVVTFFLERTRA